MVITFYIYFLNTNRSPLKDRESIVCSPFFKGDPNFKERAAEELFLALKPKGGYIFQEEEGECIKLNLLN